MTFILKVQQAPDLSTINDILGIVPTEATTAANNSTQTLNDLKNVVTESTRQSAAAIQQKINTGREARAAAREATDVGKAVMEITREIKTKGLLNQVNTPGCYAAMVARSHTLAGAYNTPSLKGLSVQTQHEIIVNIRDSHTEPKSNEPT